MHRVFSRVTALSFMRDRILCWTTGQKRVMIVPQRSDCGAVGPLGSPFGGWCTPPWGDRGGMLARLFFGRCEMSARMDVVRARCNQEERQALELVALAERRKPSEALRELIREAAQRRGLWPPDAAMLAELQEARRHD